MIPIWALVLIVIFGPGLVKMMLDSMSGQRGGFKSLSDLKSMFNVNMLVGLLTVFVILWVLIYAVPGIFHSIFNTIIGNVILLLIVALSFIKDISTGIAVLVGLLLFKSLASSAHIEGFTDGASSKSVLKVAMDKAILEEQKKNATMKDAKHYLDVAVKEKNDAEKSIRWAKRAVEDQPNNKGAKHKLREANKALEDKTKYVESKQQAYQKAVADYNDAKSKADKAKADYQAAV